MRNNSYKLMMHIYGTRKIAFRKTDPYPIRNPNQKPGGNLLRSIFREAIFQSRMFIIHYISPRIRIIATII